MRRVIPALYYIPKKLGNAAVPCARPSSEPNQLATFHALIDNNVRIGMQILRRFDEKVPALVYEVDGELDGIVIPEALFRSNSMDIA